MERCEVLLEEMVSVKEMELASVDAVREREREKMERMERIVQQRVKMLISWVFARGESRILAS